MFKRWLPFSKYLLLGVGLLIHIAFFISARWTKWFNYFFSSASLHICCQGMDFYQIPNGAYSYWHGGPFNVAYQTAQYWYSVGFSVVNATVYHPVFVLFFGSFLMLFPPQTSFYVWMFIKLCIDIVLWSYFFIRFRKHKYVFLAVFLALINSTQYLEIAVSQFQFVLNAMLLLMLIVLVENGNRMRGALFYFLTLITKPIGLLWIPLLILKRQWIVLIVGLTLLLMATSLFLVNHVGDYYIHNLWDNFMTPVKDGPTQIITLNALLRYSTSWPEWTLTALKFGFLALTIILSASKRVSLQTGLFLFIVYYLLFYDLVYEYQYTSLIPILAVCLVTRSEFQQRSARICSILISLPSALFLLRLLYSWHVKLGFFDAATTMTMDPWPDPTALGWQILTLSRILPLIALLICVVKPFVLPITRDMLHFANQIRKRGSRHSGLG